jgi:cytidylate kinase
MKDIIIAIDGFSSCGKSTMAKDLAKTVDYRYIDSGAMYRATALFGLRNGFFRGEELDVESLRKSIDEIHIDFIRNVQTGQSETYLNGENVEKDIRSMEVAKKVSPVSAIDFVRKALVFQQQAMGRDKRIVMDGRDIGTVVFPDAELKIFVTAKPEIRAQRRLDELIAKGINASFEEVLQNLKTRDLIDSTRKVSPLKQTEDAIVLDNSYISIEEQRQWLLKQFERVTDLNISE